MPLSKHYGGHGAEVMRSMRKQYGPDAERVFYATENAQKKKKRSSLKHAIKHTMSGK